MNYRDLIDGLTPIKFDQMNTMFMKTKESSLPLAIYKFKRLKTAYFRAVNQKLVKKNFRLDTHSHKLAEEFARGT